MTGRENPNERERILRHRRRMEVRRRKRQKRRRIRAAAELCVLLLSLCVIFLITTKRYEKDDSADNRDGQSGIDRQTDNLLSVNAIVQGDPARFSDASVRIGSAGDVMMHLPIVEAYWNADAQSYDFTPAMELCRSAYESVDFMVLNLETSLGGDVKPYSGFPSFNSPDAVAANLQGLGVDLQLLANNHIYDMGKDGFLRTVSVMQQLGITYAGIRGSEEELPYLIRDINSIRIGIVNYTYEMENEGDRKLINGVEMDRSVENLLNSYEVSDLESFYQEVGQSYQEMRAQGVEFVIAYLHWGNEYELEANDTQKAIAQNLCNMGFDALIGSHPHVVQPLDVFTSTDGSHKMFCAYSLGNHLSNQRRDKISSRPNGHTEDGLMVNITVSRVNGAVSVTGVEAVPTYVYKSDQSLFYVIPIYNVAEVENQTGLIGIQAAVQASYDRTEKILGSGVEDAKRELGIPID